MYENENLCYISFFHFDVRVSYFLNRFLSNERYHVFKKGVLYIIMATMKSLNHSATPFISNMKHSTISKVLIAFTVRLFCFLYVKLSSMSNFPFVKLFFYQAFCLSNFSKSQTLPISNFPYAKLSLCQTFLSNKLTYTRVKKKLSFCQAFPRSNFPFVKLSLY